VKKFELKPCAGQKDFFFGTVCFDQDTERKKYTAKKQARPAGDFFCCFTLTPFHKEKQSDFLVCV